MKQRFILVGPLPPPVNGQSLAFEILVEACVARGLPIRVVNLAQRGGGAARVGLVGIARLMDYVRILAEYLRTIAGGGEVVYITLAQSRHGFLRDLVMILGASLRGIPVVGHLHGGNYSGFYEAQDHPARWLIRFTLRRLATIIVLGESLRDTFSFEPALAARVRVVPNGLAGGAAHTGEPKSAPPAPDPWRVLFLSNLVESKGYLDVLDAVPLVAQWIGDRRIEWHFAGEFFLNPADDERVRSRQGAERLVRDRIWTDELANMIFFHGPVEGTAKEELLRQSHILVLPTYYSNEGQPLAVIEAMANGLVVVSTRYRAIPDLVEEGRTGVFVQARDPQAIAEAVAALVRDPRRYSAMSRASLARFRERFTREAHVKSLLDVLIPAADHRGDARGQGIDGR